MEIIDVSKMTEDEAVSLLMKEFDYSKEEAIEFLRSTKGNSDVTAKAFQGHKGRPGKRGGSSKRTGTPTSAPKTAKPKKQTGKKLIPTEVKPLSFIEGASLALGMNTLLSPVLNKITSKIGGKLGLVGSIGASIAFAGGRGGLNKFLAGKISQLSPKRRKLVIAAFGAIGIGKLAVDGIKISVSLLKLYRTYKSYQQQLAMQNTALSEPEVKEFTVKEDKMDVGLSDNSKALVRGYVKGYSNSELLDALEEFIDELLMESEFGSEEEQEVEQEVPEEKTTMTKEVVTEKAGTSAGVKKSWRTRLAGGAKKLGKNIVGQNKRSIAEKLGRGYAKVAKHTTKFSVGVAKKFATTPFRMAGKVGRKVGSAYATNIKKTGKLLQSTGRFARGYAYEMAGKELSVTKGVDGRYRWLMTSTNAFEDRDRQIISLKAIENDLERSEKEYTEKGNYGPLRWWHVHTDPNDPENTGVEIGTCDFRGLEGRVLIESGTFNSEALGERFAAHAKELGGSIGFKHSSNEPDSDNIFNEVRIFERSFLPRERASNPYVQLTVQKENNTMVKEKMEKLAELLGISTAKDATQSAKETSETLESLGVRTKEVTTKGDKDAQTDNPEVAEKDETKSMSPEDRNALKEVVAELLGELVQEADEEEVPETETKEVDVEDEVVTAFKEIQSAIRELAARQKTTETTLKELASDMPRGAINKMRASQSDTTVTEKAATEPTPDPLGIFVDDFVLRK